MHTNVCEYANDRPPPHLYDRQHFLEDILLRAVWIQDSIENEELALLSVVALHGTDHSQQRNTTNQSWLIHTYIYIFTRGN